MISPNLLAILRCPETHQTLQPAPPELVSTLNRQIADHRLRNRGGQFVTEPIDGGLVRADGMFIYPVRGELPIMLIDEALPFTSS